MRIRVLDLESTHPTPVDGGIVEIGYADIVARHADLAGSPIDWEVIGGRGRLCHPGCPIPPETQAVHHIDDSDVADAPPWKGLFSGLLKTAERDGVIAYAAYGADMELQWMHPDWMGPTPPPMIDVYKVGLRVWEDQPPKHSNRVLQYWRRPVGLKNEDALPNHRAYPDALVTAYLLRDLLNDEEVPIEQMVDWSALPALTVRCYLSKYYEGGAGTPWADVDSGMLQWILDKGFDDKPDIRYSAEYHLEMRRMLDAEERERRDLNAQLAANGLPTEPVAGDAPVAYERQEILL